MMMLQMTVDVGGSHGAVVIESFQLAFAPTYLRLVESFDRKECHQVFTDLEYAIDEMMQKIDLDDAERLWRNFVWELYKHAVRAPKAMLRLAA